MYQFSSVPQHKICSEYTSKPEDASKPRPFPLQERTPKQISFFGGKELGRWAPTRQRAAAGGAELVEGSGAHTLLEKPSRSPSLSQQERSVVQVVAFWAT